MASFARSRRILEALTLLCCALATTAGTIPSRDPPAPGCSLNEVDAILRSSDSVKEDAKTTIVELLVKNGSIKCLSILLSHYADNDAVERYIRRLLEVTDNPAVVLTVAAEVPLLFREPAGTETLRRVATDAPCDVLEALEAAAGGTQTQDNATSQSLLDLALRADNTKCLSELLRGDTKEREWNVKHILNVTNSSSVVEMLSETVPYLLVEWGNESLIQAARDGRCEALAALLTAGIGANQSDITGRTVLEIAAEGRHLACISALRERGVERLSGADWEEELCEAVFHSRPQQVAALLAAGVNPDAMCSRGYAALALAAGRGCTSCVEDLLRHGADPEAPIEKFWNGTSLMLASLFGRLGAVQALISAGVNVNAKDADGNEALHWAARQGHVEVVRALLAAGGRIDAKGFLGWTPVKVAAFFMKKEVVQILLQSEVSDITDRPTDEVQR